MGLILFIAIGLLSCAFLLFVLAQWIREGRRTSPKRKAAEEASLNQPFLVHSNKVNRPRNKAAPRKRGGLRGRPRSVGLEGAFDDFERAVYERIARHAVRRNRS